MKRLLAQSIQAIVNVEVDGVSQSPACHRPARRSSWHTGYSWRKLATRFGTLELLVPHAREGKLLTAIFERYETREAAFITELGRMCVRGRSSPTAVRALVEDLCGHPFTPEAVAALAEALDAELADYLRRQLEREHPTLSAPQRTRSSVLDFADV